jgi:O-antigen ligase
MSTTTRIVTAQVVERRRSSHGSAVFLALLVLPSLLVLPLLWSRPIRGLWLLVTIALLIEIFPLGFPDSLTDRIPMFSNLNNSAGLGGVAITPVELLMLAAVMVWLAKGIALRAMRWPRGRLLVPFLLYLLVLAGAEVHGLAAGGDFKISLWELRPQLYAFLVFVLASSLVENRRDLIRLATIFLVIVPVRALIGAFRYYITLHGNLGTHEGVLAHEDSYFLGLFLVAALLAFLWYRRRGTTKLLLLISPLVIAALLANQRRAGELALAAAVGVVLLLVIRFAPSHRRAAVLIVAMGAVAMIAVTGLYWNKESGFAAQIVRPIKSLLGQPSPRDYLSDIYRVAENANLNFSFKSSPVIGMGFGRPMFVVYPQADISQIYPLWNYIPHNTVLWIGMRTGMVGFMAFWALIGMALLQGMQQLATRRDRLLQVAAVFAVAAIVAELVVGWADLQLENDRNMIVLGALLGILNRLPQVKDG